MNNEKIALLHEIKASIENLEKSVEDMTGFHCLGYEDVMEVLDDKISDLNKEPEIEILRRCCDFCDEVATTTDRKGNPVCEDHDCEPCSVCLSRDCNGECMGD